MSTLVSEKKTASEINDDADIQSGQVQSFSDSNLHRRVGNRQIQLFAIGGSIGTALFVSIGSGLFKGGPVGLLLAFIFYSGIMGLVNNCMAEMTVLMPVSGGFVRLAGKWVDEALGFTAGFNFFCYQAICIPFEITALNVVLKYWRDDIPVEAVCAACIVAYAAINVAAVRYYGEIEFWLSSGKVILFLILFSFTFITMAGGNPQRDAYGFRYWGEPGPFAAWVSTGDLGRFEGFLAALWVGVLMIVGPEYLSIIAAEAERPRTFIKQAYKTIYWRFAFFFVAGALCVGIIIPSDDPTLQAFVEGTASGGGTAAASPYVIAMSNLGVDVLPHVTNALLLTSIFSAGNTYVFCATRNLYGMALEGQAPKFLTRCTKNGVPIYCIGIALLFGFLSFLQASNSGSKVLDWLINLLSSGGLINFIIICITYIRFYSACKAQGVDRKTLPYRGYFQPYSAWIALFFLVLIALSGGYRVFTPGNFTSDGFLTSYAMILLAPITYLGWKLFGRSEVIKALEIDLIWLRPEIDDYESRLPILSNSFWSDMRGLVQRTLQRKTNKV
ncbi:Ff.00g099280.m01.CDS01 [Fusarium sp. VM40]|nr:Ff.00g099280.m01.CDS01 [Fusarium sp. VM40]